MPQPPEIITFRILPVNFAPTEKCPHRIELCDLHNTVDYWRGYLKALNDCKIMFQTEAFIKGAMGLQKALLRVSKLPEIPK